jgi:hypothetical protein
MRITVSQRGPPEEVVVVERTKLNPRLSQRKRQKEVQADDYINTIKLASRGHKACSMTEKNMEEDKRAQELLGEKKPKKKGWALLCC